MFRWLRRRQGPQVESVPTQLRIVRAHIAALTSELSTLRVQVTRANDYTNLMMQRIDKDWAK